MSKPSANGPAPEPGPPPERFPRRSVAFTLFAATLYVVVNAGAPVLAPVIRDIVNDIDFRYGLSSPLTAEERAALDPPQPTEAP